MKERNGIKKLKQTALSALAEVGLFTVAQAATTSYSLEVVATINLPGQSEKGDVIAADP